MSWFFGKKKQKESPTDSSTEETPGIINHSDDYILIDKHGNPITPQNSLTGNNSASSDGRLYPYLNDGTTNFPSVPSTIPQQITNISEQQNYLTGVPFKLSKELDDEKSGEIEKLKIDEIISFILRINNENYVYDFGLEESVINELESTTE